MLWLFLCLLTGIAPLCASEESLEKIFACLADRIHYITQLNSSNDTDIATALASATEKIKHRFEAHKVNPETDQASFFMACSIGNKAIINLFLDAGFNREARTASNQTPLMIAAYNGNYDTVTTLIARNARVRAVDMYNKSAKDYASDIPRQLNNGDQNIVVQSSLLATYEMALLRYAGLQRYSGMNPFKACTELLIETERELIQATIRVHDPAHRFP